MRFDIFMDFQGACSVLRTPSDRLPGQYCSNASLVDPVQETGFRLVRRGFHGDYREKLLQLSVKDTGSIRVTEGTPAPPTITIPLTATAKMQK